MTHITIKLFEELYMMIAERDRLKPAPPPKPAGLANQQMAMVPQRSYTITVTPDFFNQLRILQKQSRDLRIEVGIMLGIFCILSKTIVSFLPFGGRISIMFLCVK